ncbi:MAG TPA: PadR family transcriptional regulator [Bryobacteraceae bacterium]|nr:PadR family transcriptional regulator [Bryobacteraceae bacterium]
MRKDFWTNYGPWAWPGFGGRARFFGAGEVRLALLSLLSDGPKHGYQLMKDLEERSGGLYRASAGSIYPTLQQLEDEGLIQAEVRDGRRVYNLTNAGRAELARDPEAVNRIWRRAEQWGEWGQFTDPDTMVSLMHCFKPLMKSAWKAVGRIGHKPGGMDRIRDVFNRASRDLEAL